MKSYYRIVKRLMYLIFIRTVDNKQNDQYLHRDE